MYENSIRLKRKRPTFRQVGQYLKKPLLIVDYQNLIEDFSKKFISDSCAGDSDGESEISNVLIDKNDKPERILTLLDYRKKLKSLGPNFKFIDQFTDCYKNVAKNLILEQELENFDANETVDDINQIFIEALNKIPLVVSDEKLRRKFFNMNISIPSIDIKKTIKIEDETSELSTYWKLIEESKTSDIRGLELHEYDPEKTHWLDRPPVHWKIIEESNRKCIEWLSKYT